MKLWQPRRNFINKKWSLVVQGTSLFCFEKWTIFKKVFFASEWTFGHVQASFDRSNEIFIAEGQTLFTQYPKMLKKLSIFFKNRCFFFETFWWKHRKQLWKPLKEIFDKSLRKIAGSPNMIKIPKVFLKIFFPKTVLWTGRKQFLQLYQVCLAKSERICWFSETFKKTHNFLRVSTYLRNVSVKHGEQFWQPRRKFLDTKPNFFLSNVRKRNEKHKFFKKLKNDSIDTKRAVLTTPSKKFQ